MAHICTQNEMDYPTRRSSAQEKKEEKYITKMMTKVKEESNQSLNNKLPQWLPARASISLVFTQRHRLKSLPEGGRWPTRVCGKACAAQIPRLALGAVWLHKQIKGARVLHN